jgi:hypothetical protein
MEHKQQTVLAHRLVTLERHVRLYHRLAVGFGLIVIAAACLAARYATSQPMTIRTTRLDIVNEAGQVVLSAASDMDGGTLRLWSGDGKLRLGAYATSKGGRLEILNQEGYERFAVGTPGVTDLQGLWERHQHHVEQNTQDINRLNQELHSMESQLRVLAQPNRPDISSAQQQRDIDRLQTELNQQRHALDQQRSRLDRLDQQLRRIDRR